MSFTLKDIPNAVVEKKHNYVYSPHTMIHSDDISITEFSFNNGVDAQSSVRLRLNRHKLQDVIYNYCSKKRKDDMSWYDLADAIIAKELEIVELDNS